MKVKILHSKFSYARYAVAVIKNTGKFFRFLTYCPEKRISAFKALQHEWFTETPKPVEPSMFPTWPAKSEQARVKRKTDVKTPKAPEGAMGYNKLLVGSPLLLLNLLVSIQKLK